MILQSPSLLQVHSASFTTHTVTCATWLPTPHPEALLKWIPTDQRSCSLSLNTQGLAEWRTLLLDLSSHVIHIYKQRKKQKKNQTLILKSSKTLVILAFHFWSLTALWKYASLQHSHQSKNSSEMSHFHQIYYLRSLMHFLSHYVTAYTAIWEKKNWIFCKGFGVLPERTFCPPGETTIPRENSHCFF